MFALSVTQLAKLALKARTLKLVYRVKKDINEKKMNV